jgi:uncharacterized protein (TIGR02594 family)
MSKPPNDPPAPPVPAPEPDDAWFAPPWLHIARGELGVREIPGPRANPRIVEYLAETALRTHRMGATDETAWCSAFMCWVMERAGIRSPRSAAARDWLKWGTPIDTPRLGCVVVLDRKDPRNPRAAHVALYARRGLPVGTELELLGGNQRPTTGQVSVAPYEAKRLLGYRWPVGAPVRRT